MMVGAVESRRATPQTGMRVSDYSPSQRVSYNQEQVCLLEAFYPLNLAYNFQATIHFNGKLNLTRLEEAVSHVISRHEMLRTTIALADDGYRAFVHEPFAFEIPRHDLSGMPKPEQRRALESLLAECSTRFFDVQKLPLFDIKAVWLGVDAWKLIQVEHHVVHDGWSFGKLWSEIQQAYNALAADEEPNLPELPSQYQQFVSWQRSRMDGAYGQEALDFWCRYLDGAASEVRLGQARPDTQGLDGHNFETELAAETFSKVCEAAQGLAVSNFVLLFTVFSKLVAEKSGETDFCVGTAVSARTEPELEPIIGMVVNTIPVRVAPREMDSLDRLARTVQISLFKALKYNDVPLSLIVRHLHVAQMRRRNPVFQHCFSFHDSEVPKLKLKDATGEVHEEQNQAAKFDINVVVIPPGRTRAMKHARMFWQFSQNMFSREQATAFAREYDELLATMLRTPGQDGNDASEHGARPGSMTFSLHDQKQDGE